MEANESRNRSKDTVLGVVIRSQMYPGQHRDLELQGTEIRDRHQQGQAREMYRVIVAVVAITRRDKILVPLAAVEYTSKSVSVMRCVVVRRASSFKIDFRQTSQA
jgi:hypothetical protein